MAPNGGDQGEGIIRNQAATRAGARTGPRSQPGEPPSFNADQVAVDLWPFSIDPESVAVNPGYWELLSPDERMRAKRFRFRRDENRYVVGRAKLRLILAVYTGSAPAEIRFAYGEQGKPELMDHPGVRFNLANSEGNALLAISVGHELGVDLERLRPQFADEHIAEHFFSETEVKVLRTLPDSQQEQAFFECWTRKEAFLKAKGGGLSVPLHMFVVAFGPGQGAELLRSDLDPTDTDRWEMMDVSGLLPGHVAAIVVDAGNLPVLLTTYPEKVESFERGSEQ
jgi:4'-phosphopantetheinyl transferase